MEEVFKDIEGYEGIYKISNFGRVRTTIRKGCSVEFLKPSKNKKGYLSVDLRKPHQRKKVPIHRLVAMTFLPNPNNYPEINHKDENKENNRVDNLEWCDRLYNVQYGTGHARGVEPLKKGVNQYDLYGNLINSWDSIKDAYRATGINDANICKCCNGIMKTFRDYIWLYSDSNDLDEQLRVRLEWLDKGHRGYGDNKKVLQLSQEGELIQSYRSVREASRQNNINSGCISFAIKKGYKCHGYYWQFSQ